MRNLTEAEFEVLSGNLAGKPRGSALRSPASFPSLAALAMGPAAVVIPEAVRKVKQIREPSEKRKSKYNNQPQVVGAEKYRSKKEMHRHAELKLLEAAGAISGLKREVVHILIKPVRIQGRLRPAIRYVSDFQYDDALTGKHIVEDCKGWRTDVYRLKRHMMAAIHGIEILET